MHRDSNSVIPSGQRQGLWRRARGRIAPVSPGFQTALGCLTLGAWQAAAYFRGDSAWIGAGVALASSLFSLLMMRREHRVRWVGFLVVLAVIGFWAVERVEPELQFLGADGDSAMGGRQRAFVELSGQVITAPRHSRGGELSLIVESESAKYLLKMPAPVWSEAYAIEKGSQVEVGVLVFPLNSSRGGPPAPFSYHSYLFRQGLAAYGYVKSIKSIEGSPSKPPYRTAIYETLWHKHSGSSALSIVFAATLGMKDLLNEAERDVFKNLGMTHILVVSGFHLGVVWALIYYIARFLLRPFLRVAPMPIEVFAAIAGGIGAWGYVMLIESGLSTYRALIAITIVVLGKWFYRKLARRRAIGVALALCVALSPCAYFGVGLQLTFAALCGLWVGSRLAEANVATLSFSKCRTLIVLCFTAWVYTSVLVLFHFGHVVPLAPLYNLFLTPVFSSVVIVGGLLGIVLSALSFPGSGLLLEVVVSLTELILGLLSRYTLWGERSWAGALYFAPSEQNAIALGFLLVCLFLWVLADGTRHRSDADSTNRY